MVPHEGMDLPSLQLAQRPNGNHLPRMQRNQMHRLLRQTTLLDLRERRMSTATSGRAREYKVRDHLREHGWLLIMRAAASKGVADLAMCHEEHGLALIQVGTHNKQLGPNDRYQFVGAANLCGALPILAVAPPRQPIRYWHVTGDKPATWQEFHP